MACANASHAAKARLLEQQGVGALLRALARLSQDADDSAAAAPAAPAAAAAAEEAAGLIGLARALQEASTCLSGDQSWPAGAEYCAINDGLHGSARNP